MKLYSATIKQQEETGLQGHYHQDLGVLLKLINNSLRKYKGN